MLCSLKIEKNLIFLFFLKGSRSQKLHCRRFLSCSSNNTSPTGDKDTTESVLSIHGDEPQLSSIEYSR